MGDYSLLLNGRGLKLLNRGYIGQGMVGTFVDEEGIVSSDNQSQGPKVIIVDDGNRLCMERYRLQQVIVI